MAVAKIVHKVFLPIILLTLIACESSQSGFDWQGHRGARGLMPENTIPAFLKAVELGVSTLELDVVVTADNKVIVSHEPFLSPVICTDSLDHKISTGSENTWNIYQMTYEELVRFDCGSLPHPGFPEQAKMKAHKPGLSDVLLEVNKYCEETSKPAPSYNIELKSRAEWDHIFHPQPSVFCELVYNEINGKIPPDKLTVQSFDFRILQYFNEFYPEVRLSVLIENDKSPQENLDELGFMPEVYSSYYKNLRRSQVEWLHTEGLKVVPWTVNEVADMQALIEMGVDGIITDYPDRIFYVADSKANGGNLN